MQEIGNEYVKYKKFDNQTGPIYNVAVAEIFMIKYQNGSKDVFNEVAKQTEKKEVATPEATNVKSNEKIETVFLPEDMQSRKDVIVKSDGWGFQTKITHIDNKRIYYIKYKKNGREKDKRIKKKRVAYTLSFNEKSKQEMYPLRMSEQEFLGLPIYNDIKKGRWIVFGTNGMNSLSVLKKNYPEIYKIYTSGQKQYATGASISLVGACIYIVGLLPGLVLEIVGYSIEISGLTKMDLAFKDYYHICVNLETLDKYGIVLTPYKINPLTY